MSIYLDNAATTRVSERAAAAALEVMRQIYGNPSSNHKMGRDARAVLETGRSRLAKALGARPSEISFTSGGTESDNWAVLTAAELSRRRGRHIISSAAEHDAVLKPLETLERRGFEVTLLPVAGDGSVIPETVAGALREDTVLVSLMLVNNETGAVTDIRQIADILRRTGSSALLHTDAVQAFLKVPFAAKTLGADMISVSGHKVHAPKGVGALYIRDGLKLPPLLHGGGQEAGRRSGTEGLPLIAAFGAAAEEGIREFDAASTHMRKLRDSAVSALLERNPACVVIGGGSPHILNISLPGYKSEVLMNYLDAEGICVSKSSACKRGARSHVLEAMGLPAKVIDGALRISLSRYTTAEEVDILCERLTAARKTLMPVLGTR